MKNIAVDESLFVTAVDGIKYWVIGLINVHSRDIRLEIVTERIEEILKKLIHHHVGINNNFNSVDCNFISYGWKLSPHF